MQNILKEIIFWALLASCDFHNNEVQCPRKALLADAWSEILAGLSELGLTVITSLCRFLPLAKAKEKNQTSSMNQKNSAEQMKRVAQ